MGKFQPGKSGNPGGRPKEVAEVKALARQHTEEAISTLATVMKDTTAPPSARVMAAGTILDRGWGKAPQHLTIEKTPLDDLDPATLAALADALAGTANSVTERDAGTTRH